MAGSSFEPDAIQIPAKYQAVRFKDEIRNLAYDVIVHEPPSPFEQWHVDGGGPSGVAALSLDLLRGRGLFIDVGANIGLISIPVAKGGASVICVEPNPKNCFMLTTGAAINGLANLSICQGALSDSDGIAGFAGSEAWGHISASEQAQPVMCLKLDTLMVRINSALSVEQRNPFVIKIDVEGHEASVLKGAAAVLEYLRPIIIFESIEIEGEVVDSGHCPKRILEGAGYTLFLMREMILSPCKGGELQEGHVSDYLAVPSELSGVLQGTAWQMRALTQEERLAWLWEMAKFPQLSHRRHAVGVLHRWQREANPAFLASRDIVEYLLSLDEIADRRGELEALLLAMT